MQAPFTRFPRLDCASPRLFPSLEPGAFYVFGRGRRRPRPLPIRLAPGPPLGQTDAFPSPAVDAMAPTDKIRPPFRWEFVPVEAPRDKAIHWTWRAYNHGGGRVMEAGGAFETLEACVEDAVSRGYVPAA